MWRRPEELEESRGVTARQSATERSHSGFIDLVVVIGVVEPVDCCSNRRGPAANRAHCSVEKRWSGLWMKKVPCGWDTLPRLLSTTRDDLSADSGLFPTGLSQRVWMAGGGIDE